MRLSTEGTRDDARSLEILRVALDEGIALFDTADAYALDDEDIGHNERLIASAIAGKAAISSAPERVLVPEVVTKGGLVRPDGAWVPKGNARHLEHAARASRDRLLSMDADIAIIDRATSTGAVAGTDGRSAWALDLYLLHVVDPRVPLATSVRALSKIRDAGIARRIGLSNVTLHQLEEALAITSIDAVELELGPYKLDALHSGLVTACLTRGIRVLAYRPLGGRAGVKRIARDKKLRALADSLAATSHELVLAWLAAKDVVPIPGATRVETVRSIARANKLTLEPSMIAVLDEHFANDDDAQPAAGGGKVILVMGMPGAGKTTIAKSIEAQGYTRLNRDEKGGSLTELAKELGRELSAGATRVVLDNTYGSRASRAIVIRTAKKHGARVVCRVVTTSLEQAQHNAAARVIEQHGRLLEPAEMQATKAVGPGAQFRYRKSYEPPRLDEGFASIEDVAFERRPTAGTKTALIVELDGIVWRPRPTSADVKLVDGAREQLAKWHQAGRLLAGTTWQTSPLADARLRELLDLPIEILRCSHPAGPPVCWCRKPMPGLAIAFARAHDVDLARSIHVGHGPADRGFALRAGLVYFDVGDGWPDTLDA